MKLMKESLYLVKYSVNFQYLLDLGIKIYSRMTNFIKLFPIVINHEEV